MADLKLVFVFFCVFALAGLSRVDAATRPRREAEETQDGLRVDQVQEQLMTAFNSVKKTLEEVASKFNTEEIAQGLQSLSDKIETYAKQAAEQFASTASEVTNPEKSPEAAPQQPQP